jgi:chromosome condensin MukBEF ATPase and DNA-binding subunit MukB
VANPLESLIIVAFLYLAIPKLYEKIKKDGYQSTDPIEAVTESSIELKNLIMAIEGVAKDVTINDADTVKTIISYIDSKKKL